MVTRITGVLPRKVEGIQSGEEVPVEISYNAEHAGLPISAKALSPHYSASLAPVPAEVGDCNTVMTRLVLTRAADAEGRECLVEFRLGASRPFQVLFSVEGS
jgi:hypothetical protein